jgi:hypothetical protein
MGVSLRHARRRPTTDSYRTPLLSVWTALFDGFERGGAQDPPDPRASRNLNRSGRPDRCGLLVLAPLAKRALEPGAA